MRGWLVRSARGGRSWFAARKWCGFRESAAATRQPSGPGGRKPCTCVSALNAEPKADPRLDGRAVKRVLFDEQTIAHRVAELGAEITRAYPEGELLVLGLLKGSFIFLSDLVRQITRPLQVDFLVASSYGDKTYSSGNVRLLYDPETKLEGKHILLVEDRSEERRVGKEGRARRGPAQARS